GERAERDGWIRWPRRGDAGLAHRVTGLVRTDTDARQLAHSALAGAHGQCGVPFQGLDMIEAFADAVAQIGGAHVGTKADEGSLVKWNFLGRKGHGACKADAGHITHG